MGHCPGGCSGDVDGSVGLWAEGISFFSSSPPLVSPVRGVWLRGTGGNNVRLYPRLGVTVWEGSFLFCHAFPCSPFPGWARAAGACREQNSPLEVEIGRSPHGRGRLWSPS